MDNILLNAIQEGTFLSAINAFLIMIFLAFIPAMPLPLVTAIFGTTFDFWTTLFISWGGSTVGAFCMFLLSRFIFQERASQYINKHKKTKVIFQLVENNAFLTVLILRLTPIFPSVLINLVCSLTKISGVTFFIATSLGKLPTMVTFALAGNHLETSKVTTLIFVGLYSMIIILLGKKLRNRIEYSQK